MADLDIVDLRKRDEQVCQDFPSDLKREYQDEYQDIEDFIKECLKLKDSFTNDDSKELRELLNNAVTIMGGRAYNMIEETAFEIDTLNNLEVEFIAVKTE